MTSLPSVGKLSIKPKVIPLSPAFGTGTRRVLTVSIVMNRSENRVEVNVIKTVCWRRRFDGLPVWLRRVLNCPPRRGEGLHSWLFSTARQLHAHFSPEDMYDLFAQITEADDREIEDAVYNSIDCAWQPRRDGRFERGPARRCSGYNATFRRTKTGSQMFSQRTPALRSKSGTPALPKWPEPDLAKIEAVVTTGPGLAGLRQWSSYVFAEDDPQRYTDWIIRRLFVSADNPDPYLCFGLSQREFATYRLSEWGLGACDFQFIVPSPMTNELGRTKAGHPSAHTLDNTGPRRFLVIECDFSILARDGNTETRYAPLIRRLARRGITVADMCASILLHLAECLPLVMALSSGGKSEHGWYFVHGKAEAELHVFMEYAVSLGADHTTWPRSQFVRLPDGTRDSGKRQVVHYLDPQPLDADRPKRAI
jgi:hypothetical protein